MVKTIVIISDYFVFILFLVKMYLPVEIKLCIFEYNPSVETIEGLSINTKEIKKMMNKLNNQAEKMMLHYENREKFLKNIFFKRIYNQICDIPYRFLYSRNGYLSILALTENFNKSDNRFRHDIIPILETIFLHWNYKDVIDTKISNETIGKCYKRLLIYKSMWGKFKLLDFILDNPKDYLGFNYDPNNNYFSIYFRASVNKVTLKRFGNIRNTFTNTIILIPHLSQELPKYLSILQQE